MVIHPVRRNELERAENAILSVTLQKMSSHYLAIYDKSDVQILRKHLKRLLIHQKKKKSIWNYFQCINNLNKHLLIEVIDLVKKINARQRDLWRACSVSALSFFSDSCLMPPLFFDFRKKYIFFKGLSWKLIQKYTYSKNRWF